MGGGGKTGEYEQLLKRKDETQVEGEQEKEEEQEGEEEGKEYEEGGETEGEIQEQTKKTRKLKGEPPKDHGERDIDEDKKQKRKEKEEYFKAYDCDSILSKVRNWIAQLKKEKNSSHKVNGKRFRHDPCFTTETERQKGQRFSILAGNLI